MLEALKLTFSDGVLAQCVFGEHERFMIPKVGSWALQFAFDESANDCYLDDHAFHTYLGGKFNETKCSESLAYDGHSKVGVEGSLKRRASDEQSSVVSPRLDKVGDHSDQHLGHGSITTTKWSNVEVGWISLTEDESMIKAVKGGCLVAFRWDLFSDNCKDHDTIWSLV